MTSKGSFGKKLKGLFRGKRRFPQRLLLAALPALAFSFTLFFFGPLDLSYVSRNFVSYSALDILPYTALLTGVVFLILLLAASIPGGAVHAFLVSVYAGLSAAMYVQGAFLNPDFGVLDGTEINWPSFSRMMAVNLAVWLLILLIPHLIHYFSNRVWRTSVILVCAALVLMQGVSLGVKLADQMETDSGKSDAWYMSNADILNLGKNKNVIVFLLDSVSNSILDDAESSYENIMYPFRDFTRFDNAATHYQRTVPSMVNLLTGETWNCTEEGYLDYYRRAWASDTADRFYGTLKENGFHISLYALKSELTADFSDIAEIADNVVPMNQGRHLERRSFMNLVKLSFYRYFPICAKPFFLIYSTDVATMFSVDHMFKNQWDFVNRYNDAELTAEKDNAFIFYYLQGSHHPFVLDETGHWVGNTGYTITKEMQTAGFLNLMATYIYQMKLLGIYDDSEIIILADHGASPVLGPGSGGFDEADYQPILFVKRPGEQHETYAVSHAPVTIQEQFLSTVFDGMGLNGAVFGQTFFDVSETEPIERWSRFYAKDPNFRENGSSHANILREFRYGADGYSLNEAMMAGEYEDFPMVDSFY